MSGKTTSSKAATAASKTLSSGEHRLEKQIGRRIGPLSEGARQHEEHFGPGRVQSLEGVERRPQLVRHEVGGRLGALAEEMTLTALGPAKDR